MLKEDLRQFWKLESKEIAKDFIETWVTEAKTVANKHVTTFAKTIEKRKDSILSWYDHPITTGPLEGTNNKIKVLKRSAYGYRDMAFFGLLIMFIHESTLQLNGV